MKPKQRLVGKGNRHHPECRGRWYGRTKCVCGFWQRKLRRWKAQQAKRQQRKLTMVKHDGIWTTSNQPSTFSTAASSGATYEIHWQARAPRLPRWVDRVKLVSDVHRWFARRHKVWGLRDTARRLDLPLSEVSVCLQLRALLKKHTGITNLPSREAAYRYLRNWKRHPRGQRA